MTTYLPAYIDAALDVLGPLDQWSHQCHAASLTVVKADVIPGARVARGSCVGVGGQHSWIVVGDPYDDDVMIIDPTLWSYRPDVAGVWTGTRSTFGWHTPQGHGSIWKAGRPDFPVDEPFDLAEAVGHEWSESARLFIDVLGPLDEDGWRQLAHLPVGGWPSKEMHTVMQAHHKTRWAPIDIVGMATDLNPSGLYLPGDEVTDWRSVL